MRGRQNWLTSNTFASSHIEILFIVMLQQTSSTRCLFIDFRKSGITSLSKASKTFQWIFILLWLVILINRFWINSEPKRLELKLFISCVVRTFSEQIEHPASVRKVMGYIPLRGTQNFFFQVFSRYVSYLFLFFFGGLSFTCYDKKVLRLFQLLYMQFHILFHMTRMLLK